MKRTISIVLVLALGLASVSPAAEDTWTKKADMPTARELCGAGVVNEKIYVIGGWDAWNDPTPLATVEVYDPATDTWERKADMPTARGALAAAVVDGKIYAIGGARGSSPLSTVEVYDPTTDTWEKKANMQMARRWSSAAVVDGKIYAIGSYHSSAMEVYDPAADTWTKKASLPTDLWVCGVGVVNSRIYALGGDTSQGLTSSVIEYDPAADSWTQKANMPAARAALSAAVVDGKIYAIGGGPCFNCPSLPTVEVYDPAMDTWEKKADMPTARESFATGIVNGRIYAIGGAPVSGTSSKGRCLTTVYEYDLNSLVVDFNGDGIVDCVDMCMMIDHWHTDEPLYDIGPRPFGDGIVDVQDLVVLAEHLLTYPGAVAYWKLDETEGDIAYDSVAANDAVVIGEAIWQPDGGMVTGALQLDGINDYVSTPVILDPAEGDFSVFVWIKGGAPGQVVISQTELGGANWLLADSSEGNLMTELKGTGRSISPLMSESVVTDGDWHQVGFVRNGSDRILYVDDIEVARDTATNLESASGGLYIGAGSDLEPGAFWSGLIDDVRIYGRAVIP